MARCLESDGLFRWVSIIKLLRKFDGDAKDPNLSEKLKSEIDAITSRALDALGRLIHNGGQFTKPQSSEAAKAVWRADNNHVEQFLTECVYENADDRITLQLLYDSYKGWFQSTGLRGQLGRSQFGKRVEAAGVPKRRMSEGYCFIGISLR
jgi:putative DNA primase/helicase